MLKVFVPNYDGPTASNARLVNDIFPNSPRFLAMGENASRSTLHDFIGDLDTTAIIVMAHGGEDCVLGQRNEIALDIEDIKNNAGQLLRIKIFVWACRTSVKIGQAFHQAASQYGGSWWGYRTTISAPSARHICAYRDVFNFIKDNFYKIKKESDAKVFFQRLKKICDTHYDQIVLSIAVSRQFGDAHEVAVGLKEVWMYLDAMLPGIPQPYQAEIALSAVIDGI